MLTCYGADAARCSRFNARTFSRSPGDSGVSWALPRTVLYIGRNVYISGVAPGYLCGVGLVVALEAHGASSATPWLSATAAGRTKPMRRGG